MLRRRAILGGPALFHSQLEETETVSALLVGSVDGDIGAFDEIVRMRRIGRCDRNANARADLDRCSPRSNGALHTSRIRLAIDGASLVGSKVCTRTFEWAPSLTR